MFQKALWNSPPNLGPSLPPAANKTSLSAINHHGFSKDKKKKQKKNKAIDTISQIVQPWPARGEEQPDTAPRPGIVFPTHRQPFPRYHFINSISTRPLTFQNHRLYNLLPLDISPQNGALVHPPPPLGKHDQTKWRSAKSSQTYKK